VACSEIDEKTRNEERVDFAMILKIVVGSIYPNQSGRKVDKMRTPLL
jgi:hypothetical protein